MNNKESASERFNTALISIAAFTGIASGTSGPEQYFIACGLVVLAAALLTILVPKSWR